MRSAISGALTKDGSLPVRGSLLLHGSLAHHGALPELWLARSHPRRLPRRNRGNETVPRHRGNPFPNTGRSRTARSARCRRRIAGTSRHRRRHQAIEQDSQEHRANFVGCEVILLVIPVVAKRGEAVTPAAISEMLPEGVLSSVVVGEERRRPLSGHTVESQAPDTAEASLDHARYAPAVNQTLATFLIDPLK